MPETTTKATPAGVTPAGGAPTMYYLLTDAQTGKVIATGMADAVSFDPLFPATDLPDRFRRHPLYLAVVRSGDDHFMIRGIKSGRETLGRMFSYSGGIANLYDHGLFPLEGDVRLAIFSKTEEELSKAAALRDVRIHERRAARRKERWADALATAWRLTKWFLLLLACVAVAFLMALVSQKWGG